MPFEQYLKATEKSSKPRKKRTYKKKSKVCDEVTSNMILSSRILRTMSISLFNDMRYNDYEVQNLWGLYEGPNQEEVMAVLELLSEFGYYSFVMASASRRKQIASAFTTLCASRQLRDLRSGKRHKLPVRVLVVFKMMFAFADRQCPVLGWILRRWQKLLPAESQGSVLPKQPVEEAKAPDEELKGFVSELQQNISSLVGDKMVTSFFEGLKNKIQEAAKSYAASLKRCFSLDPAVTMWDCFLMCTTVAIGALVLGGLWYLIRMVLIKLTGKYEWARTLAGFLGVPTHMVIKYDNSIAVLEGDKVESQGGQFNVLISLVLMYLGIKGRPEIELPNFFMRSRHAESFIDWLRDNMSRVISYVYTLVSGDKLYLDVDLTDKVMRYVEELAKWRIDAEQSRKMARRDREFSSRVTHVCELLLEHEPMVIGMDSMRRNGYGRALMKWMREFYAHNKTMGATATTRGACMFSVLIGETGEGKSAVQRPLLAAIYAKLGMIYPDEYPGRFSAGMIYNWAQQEYHAGYAKQWALMTEEIFHYTTAAMNAPSASDLLRMIGENVYSLNMPDVDSKGVTFFDSKIGIASMNDTRWQTVGVNNVDALIRRLQFIRVFRKADFDKKLRNYDECWEFVLEDKIHENPTYWGYVNHPEQGNTVTFSQLVSIMVDEYISIHHRESFTDMLCDYDFRQLPDYKPKLPRSLGKGIDEGSNMRSIFEENQSEGSSSGSTAEDVDIEELSEKDAIDEQVAAYMQMKYETDGKEAVVQDCVDYQLQQSPDWAHLQLKGYQEYREKWDDTNGYCIERIIEFLEDIEKGALDQGPDFDESYDADDVWKVMRLIRRGRVQKARTHIKGMTKFWRTKFENMLRFAEWTLEKKVAIMRVEIHIFFEYVKNTFQILQGNMRMAFAEVGAWLMEQAIPDLKAMIEVRCTRQNITKFMVISAAIVAGFGLTYAFVKLFTQGSVAYSQSELRAKIPTVEPTQVPVVSQGQVVADYSKAVSNALCYVTFYEQGKPIASSMVTFMCTNQFFFPSHITRGRTVTEFGLHADDREVMRIKEGSFLYKDFYLDRNDGRDLARIVIDPKQSMVPRTNLVDKGRLLEKPISGGKTVMLCTKMQVNGKACNHFQTSDTFVHMEVGPDAVLASRNLVTKLVDYYFIPRICGQTGFCGSPYISLSGPTTGKVLGIHVAGRANSEVMCVSIVKSDAMSSEEQVKHFGSIPSIDLAPTQGVNDLTQPEPVESQGMAFAELGCDLKGMTYQGNCSQGINQSSKTVYRRTGIKEMPSIPVLVQPASLQKMVNIEGELVDNLARNVKHSRSVPFETSDALQSFQQDPFPIIKGMSVLGADYTPKKLDVMDAVHGSEFVDPLPDDTSPGYGFSRGRTKYSRKKLFRTREQGLHPLLANALQILILYAMKLMLMPQRTIVYAKDELRDNMRVALHKTRAFYLGQLQHLIWSKMVVGDLILKLKKLWKTSNVAIGVCPTSWEWGHVFRKASKYGVKNGIAGDYSGFDTTIRSQFAYYLFIYFNIYYKYAEGTPEYNELWVFTNSLFHAQFMYKKKVYTFFGSNPSGQWLTGFLNSFVNHVLMRLAFYWLRPSEDFEFDDHVSILVYGDDMIGSVSDAVKEWFNMVSISQFLKSQFNMTFTSPDKSAVDKKLIDLRDTEFLGRSFIIQEDLQEVVGPLRDTAISGMLYWTKDKEGEDEILLSNLQVVCEDRFYYGRKAYNEFVAELRSCLPQNCGFIDRGYDFWLQRYRDHFH